MQLYKRKKLESQDDKISQSFAFAELVKFIEEQKLKNKGPLRLADVTNLYISRLKQYGINQSPHSTRLKNHLLGTIPDLQACTSGKKVLLAFIDQVGHASNSTYTCSPTYPSHSVEQWIRKRAFLSHSLV